jgi:hypothetical protein
MVNYTYWGKEPSKIILRKKDSDIKAIVTTYAGFIMQFAIAAGEHFSPKNVEAGY